MDNIVISKSLIKNRLIFKNSTLKLFDIVSFSLLLAFVGFVASLRFFSKNLWFFFFSIVIPICAILSILKWNRVTALRKIVTNKSKLENKKLISKLLVLEGYKTTVNNKDIVIASKRSSFLWFRMDLNIINNDDTIYINTSYSDTRSTWPSINQTNRLIEKLKKINAST